MKNYTPEEFAEQLARNRNFRGTRANFQKLLLYRALEAGLRVFVDQCEAVLEAGADVPNVRERHALLWIDFAPAAVLRQEDAAMLAELLSQSDEAFLASTEGHVRLSLVVMDIWDK